MLANICQNVVRNVAPAYVSGSLLLLDAGQTSSYSSGTTWVDLSGNALDYTWSGGYGRAGSGTTAYFTLDGTAAAGRTNQSFYSTAQTWSIWLYVTTHPGSTARFFEESNAGNSSEIQMIWRSSPAGALAYSGYETVVTGYRWNIGDSASLALNTWYNISGSHDASSAYVYVNGVQILSGAVLGSVTSFVNTFGIGGSIVRGSGYITGRIAQVILYASALTPVQIATNYNVVCDRYSLSTIPTVAGVWSTSGNASAVKNGTGAAGVTTAAIIWGGYNASISSFDTSETFNGSTWTGGGTLNTPRNGGRGSGNGSTTAALAVGGYKYQSPGGPLQSCEAYNGSAWTTGTNVGVTIYGHNGAGTSTDCMVIGGFQSNTASSVCNTYNGSTWSAAGSLSAARYSGGSCGASTSAVLMFGGNNSSDVNVAICESYNGSAWSSIASFALAKDSCGGCGTQSSALAVGGANGTLNLASTLNWNGTAWAIGGNLLTNRASPGTAGTSTSAMATCGSNPTYLQSTETYA